MTWIFHGEKTLHGPALQYACIELATWTKSELATSFLYIKTYDKV